MKAFSAELPPVDPKQGLLIQRALLSTYAGFQEPTLRNAEYTLSPVTDDFGYSIPAYTLGFEAYGPRYYYFKGDV